VSDRSPKQVTSRKQLVSFLASIFFWSVIINYPWEMLQMPLYNAMPFSDWRSWVICFRASLGDGVIISLIWGFGLVFFRDLHWYRRKSFFPVFLLLISGALIAVLIEIHAIDTGRWSYSGLMPILPPFGVGLSPFIQLLILPRLAMELAYRFMLSGRVPQSGVKRSAA